MTGPHPMGPSGEQVQCSNCGSMLDALRAGHLAIFDSQFHFFCDREGCRARYLGQPVQPLPSGRSWHRRPASRRGPGRESHRPPKSTRHDGPTSARPRSANNPQSVMAPVRRAASAQPEPVPARLPHLDTEVLEPIADTAEKLPRITREPMTNRADLSPLLVGLGLFSGLLTMSLELADVSTLVGAARSVLLLVGSGALITSAFTQPRDGSPPHPLLLVAALIPVTILGAVAAIALEGDDLARVGFLCGCCLLTTAINALVTRRADLPLRAARLWATTHLSAPARRPGPANEAAIIVDGADVVVGDMIVVAAGETCPVDLAVVEGQAEVRAIVGNPKRVARTAGDIVVAGTSVVEGELKGRATWVGDDRALARPLTSAARRIDVHARPSRIARLLGTRLAPVIATLAAVAVVITGPGWVDAAMMFVATYTAFGAAAVTTLAGAALARGARLALSRGIIYRDEKAWRDAANVGAAVFCARGTVLRGEPELVEIETIKRQGLEHRPNQILGFAAGAFGGRRDPLALAIRRAARDRQLAGDAVRNARAQGADGVTAVASTGEALVVGNRQLMMNRRISIARAEDTIRGLEATGRTAVMVAIGGRLAGVLALQDGLRSGARASVQHLLDARIEPILMSADTRQTCEALGQALDIDHLRPEMAESDRAEAIARIRDTAGKVAVLGHFPHDEAPLLAADVSVALSDAGHPKERADIALVSDDVRDASLGLALAQRTMRHANAMLLLIVGPALFAMMTVIVGLLPYAYLPLAQVLGAIAASVNLSAFDRKTNLTL